MPSSQAQSPPQPKAPSAQSSLGPKLFPQREAPSVRSLSFSAKPFPSRLSRLPRQRGARSVQALKGIEAAGAISSREEKKKGPSLKRRKGRPSKEERPEPQAQALKEKKAQSFD